MTVKKATLSIYLSALLIAACSLTESKNTARNLAKASGEETTVPIAAKQPMVIAANAFLESLSPELKATASFPFDHGDREQFNFVPLDDRKGTRIGHLNEPQLKLAFEFLQTGLSKKGYEIVRDIMTLEEVLIIKEKQVPGSDYRNPTKYYLSIFGTPSDKTPWGWKYEGHHLSLNYSSVSGELSVTPAFLGANPAEVHIDTDKGKRVLGDQEDQGRGLMTSLDPEQQKKALISDEAYREILTGTESHAHLENFEGLSYAEMTPEQQTALIDLIQLHNSIMKPQVATDQWNRVKEHGLDKIFFAWAGSLNKNQKHYYRIHGPTMIIEYDNTQNDGNHAHIVWRDTENDFGRDLLKAHHLEHTH